MDTDVKSSNIDYGEERCFFFLFAFVFHAIPAGT